MGRPAERVKLSTSHHALGLRVQASIQAMCWRLGTAEVSGASASLSKGQPAGEVLASRVFL